jgi:predicted transcriptional regulator
METMNIKLYDSELKVMEILWQQGDVTAKKIAQILAEQIAWGKTTTYTVIKKCIDKGAVERIEPGFICRAVITREQAREYETTELINKMYDGAVDTLVASLVGNKKLTAEEITRLKKMINDLE